MKINCTIISRRAGKIKCCKCKKYVEPTEVLNIFIIVYTRTKQLGKNQLCGNVISKRLMKPTPPSSRVTPCPVTPSPNVIHTSNRENETKYFLMWKLYTIPPTNQFPQKNR